MVNSKLTSFPMLVITFTLLLSLFFFFWNHYIIHHAHPNHCAMTYFHQEMTPIDYAHPFYELAEFNMGATILPATHELFVPNDEILEKASQRSFPTLPSHPDDEMQHLIFFFPGNAGNRWQVRSLGTKIEMYLSQLATAFESFQFNGMSRNENIDPNLTQLPPKLSYLFSQLSQNKHWDSEKSFYSKYYQAATNQQANNNDNNNASSNEWYDSTMDLLHVPNLNKFTSLNNDTTTATLLHSNYIDTHMYTFNFNEQASAFSGFSLESQQEFAVYSIIKLAQRYRRNYNGKVQISLVGHSMGGVIALSSVEQILAAIAYEKLENVSISSVITVGSPVVPLYIPDHYSMKIFDEVERFTFKHEQCHPSYNNIEQQHDVKICNIAVSHLDGSQGDELVPTLYTAATRYQHYKHAFAVTSTDLSIIRGTSEHDCLAYCAQIMETVAILLLRKSVLDSLVVGQIDLIQTEQDPFKRNHQYPRATLKHFTIPDHLLYGNYDRLQRLEYQSILTTTLPKLLTNPPLLTTMHDLSVQSTFEPVVPQIIPTQLVKPITRLSVHFDEIFQFIQPYTGIKEQIMLQLPTFIKSIQLHSLPLKSKTTLFTYATQFPSTLQLCPTTTPLSKTTPLHTCISLNTHFKQEINTPAFSYPIWKQPHTVRADPDHNSYHLSRSSQLNHQNDVIPGDSEHIQPRSLIVTQNGFSMVFTLDELYQYILHNNIIPARTTVNNDNNNEQSFHIQYKNELKSFETFLQHFSFQILITPTVLEGIYSIHHVTNLDVSLHNDMSIPMIWSTTIDIPQLQKQTTTPHIINFQLALGSTTTTSSSTTSSTMSTTSSILFEDQLKGMYQPTAAECEILGALLISKIAFPIVSLDLSVYIPALPPQQSTTSTTTTPPTPIEFPLPIYHITQTHQFQPTSTYSHCLLPTYQRYLQASPVNALVDVVAGRIYPRNQHAPAMDYIIPETIEGKKNALLLPSIHTTLGLLPIPTHLTSAVIDSVQVVNPPSPRPGTYLIPIILPQNFNIPMLPQFIQHVYEYLFSMVFPLISLSIQLLLLTIIWKYICYLRTKQFLSIMIDHFDDKNLKEQLQQTSQQQPQPIVTTNDDDDNNNDLRQQTEVLNTHIQSLQSQRRSKTISKIITSLFKYFLAFVLSILFCVMVTIPLIFRTNPQLSLIFPSSVVGILSPFITIQNTIVNTLTNSTLYNLIVNDFIPSILSIISSITYSIIYNPTSDSIYKHIITPTIIPTINWFCSWFSFLKFFFNHSASPIFTMHYHSTGAPYRLTTSEYYLSIAIYYFLAYTISQLLFTILGLITWIITLPFRFVSFIISKISFFATLYDIFLPLTLLFGYTIPLIGFFAYSILLTITQFIDPSYLGYSISSKLEFINWFSEIFINLHCFFKQGIYFAINHFCTSLKEVLTSPTSVVTSFTQQYPKQHFIQHFITFIRQLSDDLISYTQPSQLPTFQCLVHPTDFQLLPIPFTTTTILFITFIWTLLFVSILRSFMAHQYSLFYSNYLNEYHNPITSQAKTKLISTAIHTNDNNNTNNINDDTTTNNIDDDGMAEESNYLLCKILHYDYKLSYRFASQTFTVLFICACLTVLLIFPSTQVISDTTDLSMKSSSFRTLYQGLQGQTLKRDQFQLKLDRLGFTLQHFYKYAQETVAFSLFYPLLNKWLPSQTHNIYAKLLLTAQWYQQPGAWMPTTPVDLVTQVNFYTSLAFSILFVVQVLAILAYFIYIHNAKLRAIEIKRAIDPESTLTSLVTPPTTTIDTATNNNNMKDVKEQVPQITLYPVSFSIVTHTISILTLILIALLGLVVFSPYYLPTLLQSDLTTVFPSTIFHSVYEPFLLNNQFPLHKILTPYHQSILPLPMFILVILLLIFFSYDCKLVIPNQMERGHKSIPAE